MTTIALLYSGSFPVLVVLSLLHGLSFTFFPVIFNHTLPIEGHPDPGDRRGDGILKDGFDGGSYERPHSGGGTSRNLRRPALSPNHRGYGRSNTDHRGLLPPRPNGIAGPETWPDRHLA